MAPTTIRLLAGLLACLAVAACNTPRGAGFQSEVLKQSAAEAAGDGTQAVPAGFTVYPLTRASVAQAAGWPRVGPPAPRWIRRQAQPASLIIAPGDLVTVQIWDTETDSLLSEQGQRSARLTEMKVSSSGSVFLPFIGEIRLSGMSPQSARARIEERYVSAIPSAQVQVSVTPGRANTANLVSGVARPGVFPLEDRNVSLLDLIAMGGGVPPALPNPQVRLFRGGSVYGISLERLFADPALDTTLAGGDRVIVEPEKRRFLSLGAAGSEAEHIFPRDRITALEAMSIIGGLDAAHANAKGILVLREYPAAAVRTDGTGPAGTRVVFTLDLTTGEGLFSARNFEIMPDDLVYVSENAITATRTVVGLIGSFLGLANRLE